MDKEETVTDVSIEQVWDAVAEAWDEKADYVDRHKQELTAAMLRKVEPKPGDRVLELAAGPGSLGATWSELVGPEGAVLLSDISPAMVEAARRRNKGLSNVSFAVLDVSKIDQPNNSFDIVACRMGLMFAPEPAVAAAEIARVLAPGGRAAVMTWAGMEHNPWMTCVGMAAAMNGLVAGPPPNAPGGPFSLGDSNQLERLFKEAGLVDVQVEEVAVEFEADDVESHVDKVSSLSPLAPAIAAATPEQRDALRQTAANLAAPYVTDEGVRLPGRALLATGTAR